jgi:hypothetical protein
MKRSREEAEVVVRLDFLTQTAHVCVAQWPSMAAKMERLYGKSLDGQSQLSRRWVIPMRAISFRRPKAAGVGPSARQSKPFAKNAVLHDAVDQGVAI